jgi:class 3 adenylate cyclase
VPRCSSCSQDNPAGARYCNLCGAPLDREADEPRDERKIVTVLFADLVGFTARAEHLDPEDVREILDAYYARLRSEIERCGGVVEKFIGDAVVAVFGAPTAHGDDPERAVRAALAVREAVAELNAADPELDLQVRLAVNTGEAIVSLGARTEAGEAMVAGDVVNTASRLQTAAPTNGILVGEETYRATRGLVDYEEADAIVVKGKRAALGVWLALGAPTGPGERAMSTAPMLGRTHEIAVLHRIFDSVTAEERPHLVTVLGDAGIGKTRLATEFTTQLEQQGIRVLRGRSQPYGTSTLYGPFAQHVKQFAGIFASDDIPAARRKLRAGITELLSEESSDEVASHLELMIGLGAEGEVADRQTLFLAARRFTEGLTGDGPVALVFEDLHWADSGTLDLLEILASRIRDVPLLLLALARPVLLLERPGWGGGLMAYTALSLESLPDSDAAKLAALLAGNRGLDADATRLAETSEGNPLFIEELVASVAERPDAAGTELPNTIRGLLSARLDALPQEERSVLLDAAVVGKVFWRGALERILGDRAGLPDALDALEARDLIRREPFSWIEGDEQFAFKHVLIRDVAYATLSRATRKDLHAAVATFLEEATGGAAATATALARHWGEAGDAERALGYLLMAAEQAGRGWAKDEAARLYGEALDVIPDDQADRRREIGRKRAMALAAFQHVEDARLIARRLEPETTES